MLNGSVSSISLIISFVRGIFFSFIYCPKKTQTCVYLRALMIQGFGWNQRWKVDVSILRCTHKSMTVKWHVSSNFFINLKSASNLNGNLNCSKELEHYAS